MKILKNRYVVGTACIVLGLLIGFVAIPGIQRGSGNATVSVIRAKQYISEQSEIMPEMLETVQVPRNSAPKDILSALPSGSYAAAPVSYTHLDVYKRQGCFWAGCSGKQGRP